MGMPFRKNVWPIESFIADFPPLFLIMERDRARVMPALISAFAYPFGNIPQRTHSSRLPSMSGGAGGERNNFAYRTLHGYRCAPGRPFLENRKRPAATLP